MTTNNPAFLLFTIPIALLYGYFFSRLYDYGYNYEQLDKMCNDSEGEIKLSDDANNNKNCYNKKSKLKDEFYDKKFVTLIVIGFIGLIVGCSLYVKNIDNKITASAMGIAIGGLITILYYIFSNWSKIGSLSQLITIGALLAGLLAGSYVI